MLPNCNISYGWSNNLFASIVQIVVGFQPQFYNDHVYWLMLSLSLTRMSIFLIYSPSCHLKCV